MNKIRDCEILPVNFRHEKEFLKNKNLNTWESIHKLTDIQINHVYQIINFLNSISYSFLK